MTEKFLILIYIKNGFFFVGGLGEGRRRRWREPGGGRDAGKGEGGGSNFFFIKNQILRYPKMHDVQKKSKIQNNKFWVSDIKNLIF